MRDARRCVGSWDSRCEAQSRCRRRSASSERETEGQKSAAVPTTQRQTRFVKIDSPPASQSLQPADRIRAKTHVCGPTLTEHHGAAKITHTSQPNTDDARIDSHNR